MCALRAFPKPKTHQAYEWRSDGVSKLLDVKPSSRDQSRVSCRLSQVAGRQHCRQTIDTTIFLLHLANTETKANPINNLMMRRAGLSRWGWRAKSANVRQEWKKDESEEEEEKEEEGECFSVDSLENGKGRGTKFDTNDIRISTVSNG